MTGAGKTLWARALVEKGKTLRRGPAGLDLIATTGAETIGGAAVGAADPWEVVPDLAGLGLDDQGSDARSPSSKTSFAAVRKCWSKLSKKELARRDRR